MNRNELEFRRTKINNEISDLVFEKEKINQLLIEDDTKLAKEKIGKYFDSGFRYLKILELCGTYFKCIEFSLNNDFFIHKATINCQNFEYFTEISETKFLDTYKKIIEPQLKLLMEPINKK